MIEDPNAESAETRSYPRSILLIVVILSVAGGLIWLSTRVLLPEMRSVGEPSEVMSAPGEPVGPEGSVSPSGLSVAGSPDRKGKSNVNDFTLTSPTPGINQAKGQMPLEVTIEPRCGSWGSTLVGRIKTSPRAHVNFAVAYPDGQAYGQFGIARADTEGNLTYAWTIPPSAASGKGNFLVGSSHESEEKSAVGAWEFLVREAGSC